MARAFIVLLLVAGCGSSGGSSTPVGGGAGSGGTVTAAQAQSDCTAFISDPYCPKVISCKTALSMSDCVTGTTSDMACAMVTGESSMLAKCKTDLTAAACTTLVDADGNVTPPASCTNVFTHP